MWSRKDKNKKIEIIMRERERERRRERETCLFVFQFLLSVDNIKARWMNGYGLVSDKTKTKQPASTNPMACAGAAAPLPPLPFQIKLPFDESHPSNPSNTFISLSLSLSPFGFLSHCCG